MKITKIFIAEFKESFGHFDSKSIISITAIIAGIVATSTIIGLLVQHLSTILQIIIAIIFAVVLTLIVVPIIHIIINTEIDRSDVKLQAKQLTKEIEELTKWQQKILS